MRQRHAHAWCLAWVNGAWRDVDNTPAGWADIETGRASSWEAIADAWSRVWFEFSKWRWGWGEWKRYLSWLLMPLLLFAGWRLLSQKQWSRARRNEPARDSSVRRMGLDSEFYRVERILAESGAERRPGETLSAWLARAEQAGLAGSEELRGLLNLHYRLRFDPAGLNPEERTRLKLQVTSWLTRNETAIPSRTR